MIKKLCEIEKIVQDCGDGKVAIACAHDKNVLASIKEVHDKGYAKPILIGDKEKILSLAEEVGMDISAMEVIKETDDIKSARIAVNMINEGRADVLMKGHIQTADLMRVVLDKEKGLRTNRILSHVAIVEVVNYHKLILLTDAGINIAPDLKQKADIIRNALEVANALGINTPKVAVLSAIETVNPSMQSTLDAALLSKMAQRGQIKNCIVDGPLAMDNAISAEAAKQKDIVSEVAGDADILVVPNIESGNMTIKTMSFLYQARYCSLLVGAKVPLIVTSRADDHLCKYYSILMSLAFRRSCLLERG